MENPIGLKRWLSVCLLLTLIGSSAEQTQQPLEPGKQVELKLPAFLTSEPIKEDPRDDELRKLLKARYNLVFAEMQLVYPQWRLGLERVDGVTELAQQLLESRLELSDKPAERADFLGQFVEFMREAEKTVQVEHKHGMAAQYEVYRVRYRRLDAEILYVRAKREVEKTEAKQ